MEFLGCWEKLWTFDNTIEHSCNCFNKLGGKTTNVGIKLTEVGIKQLPINSLEDFRRGSSACKYRVMSLETEVNNE